LCVPAMAVATDVSDLSYASIKRLASDYQQRKAAFMQLGAFREWIVAPAECEGFKGEDYDRPMRIES